MVHPEIYNEDVEKVYNGFAGRLKDQTVITPALQAILWDMSERITYLKAVVDQYEIAAINAAVARRERKKKKKDENKTSGNG
jgi:hypothetical protein